MPTKYRNWPLQHIFSATTTTSITSTLYLLILAEWKVEVDFQPAFTKSKIDVILMCLLSLAE